MDLNFTIEKQTLKRTDNQQIVNWSNKYLVFNFQFSSEWANLSKFLLIFCGGAAYRFAIEQNKFTVPYTLIKRKILLFSVYGIDNEEYRITTNKIRLILEDSGFEKEIKTIGEEELTLDVVELIYTELDKKAYTTDMNNALALKTNISDIKNNLTSSDTNKPLSANQGKTLKALIDSIDMVKQDTAEDGYFASYDLKINNVVVGEKINIPKDYLLKDAVIDVCEENDVPVEGYHVGDYYFDFLVNTEDSSDPKHLYLLCNDLKDVYTGDGSTIVINNGVISVKSNVFADKTHTHTKSQITDFSHTHDDRYYTENEVNTIINNLKEEWNNRVILKGDKTIIQTGDTCDFTAYAVKDGMPVINEKIYFYKED